MLLLLALETFKINTTQPFAPLEDSISSFFIRIKVALALSWLVTFQVSGYIKDIPLFEKFLVGIVWSEVHPDTITASKRTTKTIPYFLIFKFFRLLHH
jgi:hypothetical protein